MRHSAMMPIALLATVLSLCACSQEAAAPAAGGTQPSLAELLGAAATDGFELADNARTFEFPADHGPHEGFRNEWWYLTGNLDSADGRRFGYELTFFRVALTPYAEERDSEWRTQQVFVAHFALSDIAEERFFASERFARGAADLAGAWGEPIRIWLYDWSLRHRASMSPQGNWQLQAATDEYAIELSLESEQDAVLQGDAGLSRKSAEGANASYYYSLPRLQTSGRLRIGESTFEVNGLSWLDREWSTSALAARQSGWDWFGLQLDDGRSLMFYQLRLDDGSVDPASAGSLVAADGSLTMLAHNDVVIEVLGEWQSPRGGRYPHGWRLAIPSQGIDLRVDPAMAAQELDAFVRYWEGAVDVSGTSGNAPVSGRGYVELTGYADTGVPP